MPGPTPSPPAAPGGGGGRGLSRADVAPVAPGRLRQPCSAAALRNLERKAPKHALAEVRDDFHRIVYGLGVPPMVLRFPKGGPKEVAVDIKSCHRMARMLA